jgi:hypothetical protein
MLIPDRIPLDVLGHAGSLADGVGTVGIIDARLVNDTSHACPEKDRELRQQPGGFSEFKFQTWQFSFRASRDVQAPDTFSNNTRIAELCFILDDDHYQKS